MDVLVQIGTLLAILSLLVILHEFGHYIPAKLFKTKVEKFYLFFDVKFSLFKKKIGETEYGIGWLPLGGYVKIAGMIDESMDTEQLEKDPEPWEFRSKPAWQRLIIMVGGVIVNVILAWVIYSTLLITEGDTYIPMANLEHGIEVDERGEKLGFKTGDKIISIDGKPVERFGELMLNVILGDEVTIERDGQKKVIPITDEGLKTVFTGLRDPFFYTRPEPVIGKVSDTIGIAKANGIEVGDKILSANGKNMVFWQDFHKEIQQSKGDTINLIIDRNGNQISKTFALTKDDVLGVAPGVEHLQQTDEYSFADAIPAGFTKTFKVLSNQIRQFKVIFKPKTEAYKQVKGPIGLVSVMPKSWDWGFFWKFTAMFSVWLAFVNILPIPALDGGHVMFLLYEMITGRKPSEKVLTTGQIIGFVLIMGLMVIIFGNDIWNLIKPS